MPLTSELDSMYHGDESPADVPHWRQVQRARLLRLRLAIPRAVKRAHDRSIVTRLEQTLGDVAGLTLSVYWPMKGEPELGPLLDWIAARGGRPALPVGVARAAPLVFRLWSQDQPVEPGLWGIPVPAPDAPLVTPDIVIIPALGFDRHRYRLGYGGGYFDRTLAAMRHRPRLLGAGYEIGALATIYPQPHDVPLDAVVTECRIMTASPSSRQSDDVTGPGGPGR